MCERTCVSGGYIDVKSSAKRPGVVSIRNHFSRSRPQDLACGQTYQAHIIANNKVGSSTPSIAVTARTKGNKPGVPKKSMFMKPNSTYLRLNLEAWPDNDCPVTKFVIRHRPMLQPHWTTCESRISCPQKLPAHHPRNITVKQGWATARRFRPSNILIWPALPFKIEHSKV